MSNTWNYRLVWSNSGILRTGVGSSPVGRIDGRLSEDNAKACMVEALMLENASRSAACRYLGFIYNHGEFRDFLYKEETLKVYVPGSGFIAERVKSY